ncbi:MAG: ATP synthase F1 subunit epsilon [Anaerolineae bacterium]|nr:ATP synthase F1 subunit epsilon [Caldilineales bacterium]MDW8268751.1 ATP synthase F1 subunit epsilon [Anaerolineae bacterium]
MSTIRFEFVAQDHIVYEGDVEMVVIPGADGVIGVLPRHAPLMAVVVPGEVMVRTAAGDQYFAVGGGFVEVRPDKVILVARSGEAAEEIDIARAEAAKRRAEEYLASAERDRSPEMRLAMEAALRRSTVRLQIARRRHGGGRPSHRGPSFAEGES